MNNQIEVALGLLRKTIKNKLEETTLLKKKIIDLSIINTKMNDKVKNLKNMITNQKLENKIIIRHSSNNKKYNQEDKDDHLINDGITRDIEIAITQLKNNLKKS